MMSILTTSGEYNPRNEFESRCLKIATKAYDACKPISPELTQLGKEMFFSYEGDKVLWLMFLTSTLAKMCKKNKRYSNCIMSRKEMMTSRRELDILNEHNKMMI